MSIRLKHFLLASFIAINLLGLGFSCAKPKPPPPPPPPVGTLAIITMNAGLPLEGVALQRNDNFTGTTNADGYYAFHNTLYGTYTVTGTKEGYFCSTATGDFQGNINWVIECTFNRLPRLRTEGTRLVKEDGSGFRWKGATAFALPLLLANGQTAEAEHFVREMKAEGVTLLRIFTTAARYPCPSNPAITCGMFDLPPSAGIAALPDTLKLLTRYGLYAEVVGLADTKFRTFDHAAHINALGSICLLEQNCVVEIANEPHHDTQAPEVHLPSYLLGLRAHVPSTVPVALGAAHGGDDESHAFFGADYVTVHASRAPGDEGWRWIRHSREIQAIRDSVHHKFAVNDEPERTDLFCDKHVALGAMMAQWGLGDTIHLESLKYARIPEGEELTAFKCRVQGWDVVGDFTGQYSRAPLAGDPIRAFSEAQILRLYSAINGNAALIVGLNVKSEASIVWDWPNHELLASVGNARVWRATR